MSINTTPLAVQNPKWVTVKNENLEDVQAINVEVKWSHLGTVDNQDFTLFTATSFDSEQHGKDLYAALVNGDYGDIAAE
jgi:hypothetical protein|tara:strand:+ start:451 stop:687 length:237 start_codon:yes stop_codon:yes gene_type:complete